MNGEPQSASAQGIEIQKTEHPQLQRYFELSLYLLTMTAFGILAGTGELDLLSQVLVCTALIVRGILLLRRSKARIPERWTNYFTLFFVCFFALDYLLIHPRKFAIATVHLVLFSFVTKMFSVRRERDYVYIFVLSFAMVLAASVLTADSLFFGLFCIFLFLALSTAISMEMRRSWSAAPDSARYMATLPWALVRAAATLMLCIVLVATGIFFVLPRLSAGYLSNLSQTNELTTGFSDQVRLGAIGQIQQSDAVVMHVTFSPQPQFPDELKLRGVALSSFDGQRWWNPSSAGSFARGSADFNNFRLPAVTLSPVSRNRGRDLTRLVRYRVRMATGGTQIFFLIPEAVSIQGNYRALRLDSTGSVFNADVTREVQDYSAESHVPPPMPEDLAGGRPVPLAMTDPYLEIAAVDPRTRKLAETIASKETTQFAKATAVERYLISHYTYTLQLPDSRPADPIAYFLFERKMGHCEYFASSMAVMLRTLGIPSRVVNGFRGGEFNDLTGSYIIRAKHAHSWVEAYFPKYGWYTFDPTPAGSADASSGVWGRLSLYADAMRQFWQEWVINYDFSHQRSLTTQIAAESQTAMTRNLRWWRNGYDEIVGRFRKLRSAVERAPRAWATGVISVILLSILLGRIGAIVRALSAIRIARRPAAEPRFAATIWYSRLLKLLSRRGYKKDLGQTPQEFVESIGSVRLKEPVAHFTETYERARFGESAEDAARLPDLYEKIELLKK